MKDKCISKLKYVWCCSSKGSGVVCEKCGLNYHLACVGDHKGEIMIRGNKRFIEECCQCIRLKCSRELHGDADQHGKSNRVSHENLNKVFGAILLRGKVLEPPPRIMQTNRDESSSSKISGFINFQAVKMKIEGNQYRCTEELLYDLRKIKCVTTIELLKQRTRKRKAITQYIKKVERYCREIDLCPNCAFNQYFGTHGKASLCPLPHRPILFDRSMGIGLTGDTNLIEKLEKLPPILPGKLMGFNHHKYLVYVNFFSSEEPFSIQVPRYNVYHLRNTDLAKCTSQKDLIAGKKHLEAISLSEKYIENLKQEFGDDWQFSDKKRLVRPNDEFFVNKLAEEPVAETVQLFSELNDQIDHQMDQQNLDVDEPVIFKEEDQNSSPAVFLISDDSLDTPNGKRSWRETESDQVQIKVKKVAHSHSEPCVESNSTDERINVPEQQDVLVSLMKSDFDNHIKIMIQQLLTIQKDFDQKLVEAGTLWDVVRQTNAYMNKTLEKIHKR